MSRLRRAFAAGGVTDPGTVLRFVADGYLVSCDRQRVDVHRAGALIEDARRRCAAGDLAAGAAGLAEAVALCGGEPLAPSTATGPSTPGPGWWRHAWRRRSI